jgi:hypothetical protein
MNRHKRCPVCHWNHRPGNCRKTVEVALQRIGQENLHSDSGRQSEGLGIPSMVTLVMDLGPLMAKLDRIEEKLDRMANAKRETPGVLESAP